MLEDFWGLLAFAFVATFSPGGATSLATASGARFGIYQTFPLILGIAVSLAILVATSSIGLAGLIMRYPHFEMVFKVFGSVYLLWLAVMIASSGPPPISNTKQVAPIGFVGGALLLLINPKAWAMAASLGGAFSQLTGNTFNIAQIAALVFFAMACFSLTIWAGFGALLASLLQANWHWHLINGLLALMLIGSIWTFWQ